MIPSSCGMATIMRHGYHVYRTVWGQHVGEEFIVIQESGNSHDRYVMVVYHRDEDSGVIVGHLPREIFQNLPLLHEALNSFGTHKALGSLDGVLVK